MRPISTDSASRTIPTKADVAAAAAAAQPAAALPGVNMLPFAPGTAHRLTEMELQGLQKLGWSPGQAVPANLADTIANAKADAYNPTIPPSLTAVQTNPVLRELESLPPAQQAAIRTGMEQMMQQAELRRQMPSIPGAPANLQASMAVAAAAAKASQMSPAEMAGTRPVLPTVSPQVPPPVAEVPASTPAPAPAPAPEPAQPGSNTGLEPLPPEVCPHCQLKTQVTEDPITEDEKLQFLAGICSSSGRYFETKTLLRGQLVLVFRSMSQADWNICRNKVANQLRTGELSTAPDTDYTLASYLAVANTASIKFGQGGTLDIPAIADIGDPEPLAMVLRIVEEVLSDTVVHNIWRREARVFRDKLQRIQAAAVNPNF